MSTMMMKSSVSNLVCIIVLLSSSVVSSSFSPPARFGGRSFGALLPSSADRRALLVRGGGAPAASGALSPPAVASSTAATMSGGDVEDAAPDSGSRLGPNAAPPGVLRRLLPALPWHVLPNYLTYARCLSIPLFMVLSYFPVSFPHRAPVLSAIFAVASFTDWLDGYLARRWDITSPFGAFLDPVADKLMVSTALIVLAGRYGGIVAIPTAIIMAREVGVSALREWMAQQGKRDSVKVGMQGKVKTALTMVSVTLMLLVPEGIGLDSVAWTKYFGQLGVGGAGTIVEGAASTGWSGMLGPSLLMLFASAFITVTSGSVYFRAALPALMGKE